MSRRMFFVVGAPRCGTTAISSALRDHPNICFAVPKEPHYFARLPGDWKPEQMEADYFSVFFKHAGTQHLTFGEGSPSYIYADRAIDTIEAQFPGARYIVMVRNPMEMLPSYHQRLVYLLDETEKDLVKAWRLQAERAQGREIPKRCREPHMLRYRDICNVADRIDVLVDKVGRERVKLVLFEDFSASAVDVYRDVLRFLDLPDDGRQELAQRNSTRIPKSVMLHMLITYPRSEVMRVAMARLRRIARRSRLTHILLKAIRRSGSAAGTRAVVPPELWDECAEAFRPNVKRLSELFGRDLGHWLQRDPQKRTTSPRESAAPALAADD